MKFYKQLALNLKVDIIYICNITLKEIVKQAVLENDEKSLISYF